MSSYTTQDGIIVRYPKGVDEQETFPIVIDERRIWAAQGKELAEINIALDGEELVIETVERSPINRVRRITGYLAPIGNFNASKQAELADREVHFK